MVDKKKSSPNFSKTLLMQLRRTFGARLYPFFDYYTKLYGMASGFEDVPEDLASDFRSIMRLVTQHLSKDDTKDAIASQLSEIMPVLRRIEKGADMDSVWRLLSRTMQEAVVTVARDREVYLKTRRIHPQGWAYFKKMSPDEEAMEKLRLRDPDAFAIAQQAKEIRKDVDKAIISKIQDAGYVVEKKAVLGKVVYTGVAQDGTSLVFDEDGDVLPIEDYITKRKEFLASYDKLSKTFNVDLEGLRSASDEDLQRIAGQSVEYVSLTDDRAKQGALTRIYPTRRLGDRKVIVEGRFKGIYLDDMINAAGRQIEGVAYDFDPKTGIPRTLESRASGSLEVGNVREPYITVADDGRLYLKMPSVHAFSDLRKAVSDLAKFNTGIEKVAGSRNASFYFEPKDFGSIREALGSVALSKRAAQVIEKYFRTLAKHELATAKENLGKYDASTLGGFKEGRNLYTVQKKALAWIDSRGGSGVLALGTGVGKCVAKGTLINTPNGLLPIESFAPEGDLIEDTIVPIEGKQVTVNGRVLDVKGFYYGGFKPTKKLTLKSGLMLEGSLIHPVLTLTPEGQHEWKKLPDLREGDVVCVNANPEGVHDSDEREALWSSLRPYMDAKETRISHEDVQYIQYAQVLLFSLGYIAHKTSEDGAWHLDVRDNDQPLYYDPVVSVTDGFAEIMDIEVADDSHMFVSNGIVSHNTSQALGAIKMAMNAADAEGRLFRALYVCPKSLKGNLPSEAYQFMEDPKRIIEQTDIMSYTEFAKKGKADPNLLAQYDVILFDEAQELASGTSMAAKIASRPHPRKIFLTASPMEKRPSEVYTLAALANNEDVTKPLFKRNRLNFEKRFCVEIGGRFVGVNPDPLVRRDLRTWVRQNMFHADKQSVEEYLLPDIQKMPRALTLSPEVEAEYRLITKDIKDILAGLVERFRDQKDTKRSRDKLVSTARMKLAGPFSKLMTLSNIPSKIIPGAPNPKIDAASRIVEEKIEKSGRTILFTDIPDMAVETARQLSVDYPGTRHACCLSTKIEIYKNGSVEMTFTPKIYTSPTRAYTKDEWQMYVMETYIKPNDYDVVTATLTAPYAKGHNLQMFTTVIHLDRDSWNAEMMQQREARAWRQGQKNSVEAITLDMTYSETSNDYDRTLDEIMRYSQEMEEDLFNEIIVASQTQALGQEYFEMPQEVTSTYYAQRKAFELAMSPYASVHATAAEGENNAAMVEQANPYEDLTVEDLMDMGIPYDQLVDSMNKLI